MTCFCSSGCPGKGYDRGRWAGVAPCRCWCHTWNREHVYQNRFVQCHPGNALCVPAEGNCKVCGQAKNDWRHAT